MSRISNSSFKVNSNLEQMMELSAVKAGVTVPISTASELDMNLTKVNGTAISLGETTASASLPVVLPNDVVASVSLDEIGTDAKGSDTTLATAVQVGNYGWDGSNWRQMNVTSGGNIKVESELEDHQGSQGNLENAGSVVDGDTSTAIDTSNHTLLTCFGNTTGSDAEAVVSPSEIAVPFTLVRFISSSEAVEIGTVTPALTADSSIICSKFELTLNDEFDMRDILC